jgi:hypothetical protein
MERGLPEEKLNDGAKNGGKTQDAYNKQLSY